MCDRLRLELSSIRRDPFWMGLQSQKSGNLSAVIDKELLTTRRNSLLRCLESERIYYS